MRPHPIPTICLAAALAAQSPEGPLTGREQTPHFVIHFRPGSRAEASVDRTMALVEDDLARILKELGLETFPHTIQLYLYDDVDELQRLTGVGSAGHSTTLASHLPCDNDQTRVHELVHVVAEQFAERGDEPRNLFFAEGLANAVLRFVSGVHVDAVAAFYQQRGQLPSIAEVQGLTDFYGWLAQHRGVNGYDIAGSWMRFLLDTYGAAKVRAYYKGTAAKAAFGAELAAIEQAWHAHLDAVQLRPGLRALLQRRAAVTAAERVPEEAVLGEAILGPAAAWEIVGGAALQQGAPAAWQADGALLLNGAKNEGDWCVARLGPPRGDAIVRCTAAGLDGCYGVKLQLGDRCQAIVLRGQGTFLYTDKGGIDHDGKVELGHQPVQIVLRRQRGRASIWIDGKLICEAAIADAAGELAVGSVGGKARFTAISVRAL